MRLDKDLGEFFDYLDQKLGKDGYVVFLTADHGAAHIPSFVNQHNIPGGNAIDTVYEAGLNNLLKNKFGSNKILLGIFNYQVYLDRALIKQMHLNKDSVTTSVVDYLSGQPEIYRAFSTEKTETTTINAIIQQDAVNGYYPARSGDVQVIFKPEWIENFENVGTTHGAWSPYDTHVPLLWYGWGIQHGHTNKETYMTDIAPTVAALLHIQMPNGSIGHVIEDVLR